MGAMRRVGDVVAVEDAVADAGRAPRHHQSGGGSGGLRIVVGKGAVNYIHLPHRSIHSHGKRRAAGGKASGGMRGLVADKEAVGEDGAIAVARQSYRSTARIPAGPAVGDEPGRAHRERRVVGPDRGAAIVGAVLPDFTMPRENRVQHAVGEEVAVVHIDALHGGGGDACTAQRGVAGDKVGMGVAVKEAVLKIRLGGGTARDVDATAIDGSGVGGCLEPSDAVEEKSAVAEHDVRLAGLCDAAAVGAGEADVFEDVRRIGNCRGHVEDVVECGTVIGVQCRLAGWVEGGVVGAGEPALDD